MKTNQSAAGQPAGAESVRAEESNAPSPIQIFIRLRMSARRQHAYLATINRALRMVRRRHERMVEAAMPFDGARRSKLEADIAEIEGIRDEARVLYREIGALLIAVADPIDAETTLEQRLELLNCNVADRTELPSDSQGMLYLMGVYCLEDSAGHRRDQFNDRPLHGAVNTHIQHVMFATPEGRAATDKLFDRLFAPGGLFEGVPTYTRKPDGTMLRNPPKLTLHEGGVAQ